MHLRPSASVSVIVPVRQDVTALRELIERVRAQTVARDRLEVVVGADGAPAGSLAGLEDPDGRIRMVAGPPRNPYAARNRAARMARGSVLAFCDSDCLPDATWLERGIAALDGADLVAGEVTFVAPARPTVWSLLSIDSFLDQESNVRRCRAVTANLFVRTELFDTLKGFDESLPSGGDWDFAQRAVARGARLTYAPEAVVRHPTLDDREAFLGKLRTINRCAFIRSGRTGRHRDLAGMLTLVPALGVALTRRHNSRPALRLSRRRLSASGVSPSHRDELRALAVLYTAAALATGVARVRGWRDGRRIARGLGRPAGESRSGSAEQGLRG